LPPSHSTPALKTVHKDSDRNFFVTEVNTEKKDVRFPNINQKRELDILPNTNKARETLMCLERDIEKETVSMYNSTIKSKIAKTIKSIENSSNIEKHYQYLQKLINLKQKN